MKKTIALLICIIMIAGSFAQTVLALSADTAGLTITLADLGKNVSVHTDEQTAYLTGPVENNLDYFVEDPHPDPSIPRPVHLSWTVSGSVDGDYMVTISRNADLSDAWVYTASETSLDVINLRTASDYYWTVSATSGGVEYTSDVATFTTEDLLPNNLAARGISNLRDGGGWKTLDGGRVKYGMLYRCSALSFGDDPYIKPEGIKVLHDDLGIKSEIDLRITYEAGYFGQTTSILGDDVKYFFCPMDGASDPVSLPEIKHVFEVLSDEENYPIVYHCAIGTDRTGKIAFLVNALLGVSEADLQRDYLMSSLSDVNAGRYSGDTSDTYKNAVRAYHGRTLAEKTYNYLVEVVEIEPETLEKVVSILKEFPDDGKGEPISSAPELLNMRPDGNYYLTADIKLGEPYRQQFTGRLDGAGHTITTSVPVFESFSGTVSDLTIKGSISAENADLGALAANASGVTAYNITNYADVTLVSDDSSDVTYSAGGFIGKTVGRENTFVGCKNYGSVSAYGFAAGFCGLINGSLMLSDCANYGNIVCTCPSAYCGGFAGETLGTVTVQTSFNFGDIDSAAEYTGGFFGFMFTNKAAHKTFMTCGNYGNVTSSGIYVAGFVGKFENASGIGTFNYCYNCGDVTGTNEASVAAGFLAITADYSIVIKRCYNSGNIVVPDSPDAIKSHIAYIMNYIDRTYMNNNYCPVESDTPAFTCWPDDYYSRYFVEVTDPKYINSYTAEEMFDGTLCEKLNGDAGEMYVQLSRPTLTTDLLRSGDIFKGVVRKGETYYEFDGEGKYIGTIDLPENRFDDVKDGDYFLTPVLWALKKGITSGTSDNEFSPNGKCTRGQIVMMLWRAAGSPVSDKTKANPFDDVGPDDYYYNAVLWAVENGITSGTAPGKFSPNAVCSRAQAMTFLWVYNKRPEAGKNARTFTDVPSDAYYAGAVAWAVDKGVTAGTGPDTFSPNAECVRAQIVTFLYKANY